MRKNLYIKGLHKGGKSYHHFKTEDGSHLWPLPQGDEPGAWKSYTGGALKIHFNGIHLAKADYAVCWIHDENYVAEVEGDIEEDFEVIVAKRARLVKKLTINANEATLLAIVWARDVASLLGVMDYPEPFANAPVHAIDYLEAWKKANPESVMDEGVKLSLQKIEWQAGQYERDSARSVGYRHNSVAAKEVCRAVSTLQNLRFGANLAENDAVHNLRIALKVANSAANAVAEGCSGFLHRRKGSYNLPAIYQKFAQDEDTYADAVFAGVRRKQSGDLCQSYGLDL